MTAEPPSRNDGVTIVPCPVCGASFEPAGRRRYCSDACRQGAWRRRHSPADLRPALPAKGRRRAVTVYECGECAARALGEQRCDDCNMWMLGVGVSGLCPCCDEPVTVAELMEGGGC